MYPYPFYVNTPIRNIIPNSPIWPRHVCPKYPCVPTQFNQNATQSPTLLTGTQKWIHEPNGVLGFLEDCNTDSPTPGSHQNWIYQPSNSFYFTADQNASYYFFPYEVDPKNDIVIKGRYPYARYFSFHITGIPFLQFVGSVLGRELIPDPGSTNPFLPGADWDATSRNYTLKVRFTAPPEGSNHFLPAAGNNVIYAGSLENGEPNRYGGAIFLRIYVPSIGYDQTGGVELPFITYCNAKHDKGHQTHSKFKKQESSCLFSEGFKNTSQGNNNELNQMSFDDYINLNYFANSHRENSKRINSTQSRDLTFSST